MDSKQLVQQWIDKWEKGDFMNLPLAENFRHISFFGIVDGKKEYLDLVAANKDKFLGYCFETHDEIYEKNKACIRYTGVRGDFKLEVSEWYYFKEDLIEEVVVYLNVEGEVPEGRKLKEVL